MLLYPHNPQSSTTGLPSPTADRTRAPTGGLRISHFPISFQRKLRHQEVESTSCAIQDRNFKTPVLMPWGSIDGRDARGTMSIPNIKTTRLRSWLIFVLFPSERIHIILSVYRSQHLGLKPDYLQSVITPAIHRPAAPRLYNVVVINDGAGQLGFSPKPLSARSGNSTLART